MGLDTGLQNPPSFLPPPLPLDSLTRLVVISVSGSLLPLPHPLYPGPAHDSGLKQEKEEKASAENPATGRKVDTVHLWVVTMKVQLVGDVYGCAFKLCI